MVDVGTDEFQALIDKALTALPGQHVAGLANVAILYEDEPTPEQRQAGKLRSDQTLLGLYQGTPLPQRQGMQPLYPDRITLFRLPLMHQADTEEELLEEIKHTLWHEIAHYYGLDHKRIHELE